MGREKIMNKVMDMTLNMSGYYLEIFFLYTNKINLKQGDIFF